MADRENIIAGLQEAAAYFRSSFDAMYGTAACEKFRSWTDAIEQALALPKAQEPVEPKVYEGMRVLPDNINVRYSYPVTDVFYDCGECGVNLCRHQPNHFIRFCKHCGRAVKWE